MARNLEAENFIAQQRAKVEKAYDLFSSRLMYASVFFTPINTQKVKAAKDQLVNLLQETEQGLTTLEKKEQQPIAPIKEGIIEPETIIPGALSHEAIPSPQDDLQERKHARGKRDLPLYGIID